MDGREGGKGVRKEDGEGPVGKTEKEEDLTLIDEFAGFSPPARSTHRPAVGRTDLVEGGGGCVGRGWGRARRGWNGVK